MKEQMNIILEEYRKYALGQKIDASPSHLYEPVNYIMGMKGKHMRPLLLLASCGVFTDDWKKALPAAYGLEMFHNFTLVHDDIMDEARLRRGHEAVHVRHGVNQAILSGDAMMLKSLEYISRGCPESLRSHLVERFIQTGVEVCEGQQWDMDFEKMESIALGEYLEMIRLKTAILPAEGLRIGALIGGGVAKDADHLFQFGQQLGMAFQIQDDILDAFGNQEEVGKVVGGDIRQNKKTILYILGMESAMEADRMRLKDLFSSPDASDEKVEEVKRIWMKNDVLSRVSAVKKDYHQSCLNHLGQVSNNSEAIGLLKYISELLLNRAR